MDQVKSFFMRFLSFEKLIGGMLIRVLYYVGLAIIGIIFLWMLMMAVNTMTYNFAAGLGIFIGAPIAVAIYVLFWRFICELYILLFRMSEQLNEIKFAIKGEEPPPPVEPAVVPPTTDTGV